MTLIKTTKDKKGTFGLMYESNKGRILAIGRSVVEAKADAQNQYKVR